MAVFISHVLIRILQIYIVFLNIFYGISAKKCADINCKVPISTASAVEDYESSDENYLSFKKGDNLIIYSKYVGADNSLWEGSMGSAPARLLRSDFVEESKAFHSDDKLFDLVPDTKDNLQTSENGELPGVSQQHQDEMREKTSQMKDDGHTNGLENPDNTNNSPVTSNSDDQTQAEHKHPANGATNEAANKVANDGKDEGELNQDELTNDNERTAQHSETENSPDKLEDGSLHLDGSQDRDSENNDQQVVTDIYDDGVDDRTQRTKVDTYPNGVQYDVKIEYLEQQDVDNDVEVVGVTQQEQSHAESQGSDEESMRKEKDGFFSSVKNLMSDFADNIVKDFQGKEGENGEETKDKQEKDELTEDPAKSGKIDETTENFKTDSTADESNMKPSEFKGFQARFQQIKAARLEKMQENVAAKETSILPAEDEEEILKLQAKKMVEGIPGLMKEEREEGREGDVAGEEVKNEEMTSLESGGEAESQKPPAKKYSDKVLCRSVAVKDREICLAGGSKEECLQDNCCYDETAVPGRQCFFKPSAPESGFTDEQLQKLLLEEEKSEEGNDSAVKTDKDSSESSESVESTVSEQADKTVNVSSEAKSGEVESSDIELDSARQLDNVEKSTDENGDSAKTKETESVQKADGQVDNGHKENVLSDNARLSDSLDEATESSQQDSLQENPSAGTVDSLARSSDDRQENVDEKSLTDDEEIIEEKIKRASETEGDDITTKKDAKTESVDKDDSSYEDKANVNMQESSDASVDPSGKTARVESKEKLEDALRSDDEPSTSDSSASIEKQDSLKENITEGGDLDSEARSVKSAHDSQEDISSPRDSSTKENGGGDQEEHEVNPDAGPKEVIKEEVRDETGDEAGADGGQDEMKSVDNDPKRNTSSQEDPGAKESVSDESKEEKSQQESGDDSTGSRDTQDETGTSHQDRKEEGITQDSQNNVTTTDASLVEEMSEQNEKTLPKDSDNEKAEDQPDAGGIFATIKKFLPGGGTEENTKEGTSDDVSNVSKDTVEKTSREDEENVRSESQEMGKDKEILPGDQIDKKKEDQPDVEGIVASIKNILPHADTESSEDIKDSKENEAEVKSEQEDGESNSNVTSTDSSNEGSNKNLDKSDPEKILADILEEESLNSKDTTLSDTIIPETKGDIEEKNVESGSTHFQNNTEATLPVEKTVDTKVDVNDSALQESEETKTGLEGTKTGVEETRAGVEPDIVPTKTSAVESSGTITVGHRHFEKKFPTIAPKWMKNKLMKGKRMAEKDTEVETSEDVKNENLDSGKVDENQDSGTKNHDHLHSGTKDHDHPHSGTKDHEDPHSGTCAKDGTCEGTNSFSSSIHRSILGNDDDLDGDDIVEPSPPEEDDEPEVKSVKTRFLEILAVAVRKFREYHNVVAEYGLQMLKPVKNVVKSLGEQMGLGETIGYMEREMKQGPQGVIAMTLILIAFAAYFMLSVLCGKSVPPSYGPNLKDFFKTYEGRIRILEEECSGYEEKINNMKTKANEDGENSCALQKELEDEKHERNKADEQISILKEIVQNLKEKVELLEEESSKLKQSLVQKTERISTMQEELSVKSEEIETTEENIKQLDEQLKEKDEEKNVLNENIEEYKKQLSKAEDDTDRHKTMLQDWNDRYHELQQKYDDISVNNQTLEEQIHFKDNEIEVLRDSLVQINSDVHINSDEELSQEEMQEARSKKVKELMDVSQIRTDYKLCKEEKEKLEDDIKQEVDRREKLEGEVEQCEIDLAKSKASEEEIRFKYREADIKLNALQDYFKNMESDLHRKLTAEEAARMASESELERKLREASTAVQDVELYRKQVEELRKEIDETQLAFRSQISSTEERAHENWLKFRAAERESEEMKRERDALRRRLYDMKTSAKAPAPLEDSVTSTTADNLESPVPRSESPATSVRSSKRNNSNPQKSPSGSPMDERKERVRRKTRDRNSPPSWDPDMGPPPRRRDKDRETPPPPPPLWDPNMVPRRKGQRESPSMDAERRRRERYTPSPPPPPLDTMIPPSRRRRRDRPTSPPPPPPGHMLSPRGLGPPVERSPPNIPMRAGPPRMNAPRPPQDMMTAQPNGNGVRGPLENTPPPGYMRSGGVQEHGVMTTEMQRPPPNTGISPARNIGGPPPPTYISPLRGIQPQAGIPNKQSSPYVNSSLSNNTPRGDSEEPPPPPLFASNGPYPRPPPPRKIPTLPS